MARQRRVGVVAVALEGHVVRAKITFLEAPDRDAEGLRHPPRHAVDRPLVAEQDDCVRPLRAQDALERAFPGGKAVAVMDAVVADGEQGVAAVEVHPDDLEAALNESPLQVTEKPADGALQHHDFHGRFSFASWAGVLVPASAGVNARRRRRAGMARGVARKAQSSAVPSAFTWPFRFRHARPRPRSACAARADLARAGRRHGHARRRGLEQVGRMRRGRLKRA
jgi:hypothetical protein